MFWNIFKNRNKTIEEKPKIKVYDEKLNKEIEVYQEQWIKKFLKPQLNENKNNKEMIYTLLVEALNYNIYKEILEYSLRFRESDLESLRSTEIIVEIYYNSGVYEEVINLFEKYSIFLINHIKNEDNYSNREIIDNDPLINEFKKMKIEYRKCFDKENKEDFIFLFLKNNDKKEKKIINLLNQNNYINVKNYFTEYLKEQEKNLYRKWGN